MTSGNPKKHKRLGTIRTNLNIFGHSKDLDKYKAIIIQLIHQLLILQQFSGLKFDVGYICLFKVTALLSL